MDNLDKINKIKMILKQNNYAYIEIKEESIDKIYNLYINKEFIEPTNGLEFLYFGIYYQKIEKNYNEAKKYYLMAIENGNIVAMNRLAMYYEQIEKNYDEAKKYYLMAIENGNIIAMHNLAIYYQYIEKNYDEAKKYYLMAIEKCDYRAMNNLAIYYEHIEKNYDEAKKYYLMAIENGNMYAMKNIKIYYSINKLYLTKLKDFYNIKDKIDKAHILEALNEAWTHDQIDKAFIDILINTELDDSCAKTLITYKNSLIKKIDLLELHFKYAPTADGFNEAKNDFIKLIK